MRDLLVLVIVYGSLPLIPFRPFLGILVFSWLAYMRPQDLAWSLGAERFSFYVGVATLVGAALALGRERIVTMRLQTWLLLAFWIWVGITVQTALVPANSQKYFGILGKVILISLITTGLVRSLDRLRALLLVIAFSLGLLGLKYGMHSILHGGSRFNDGPGGFMNDNNQFAMALAIGIPLLFAAATTERSKWIRISASVLIVFSVLTIFSTFSRGGLLSLTIVGMLLVLRMGRPFLSALIMVLGLALFSYVASEQMHEEYQERTATIVNYEGETSAMGRLRAWEVAWSIFQDRPIVGVGPKNFILAYGTYDDRENAREVHNSFLQVLAETGLPGFLIFTSLIVVSLWRLQIIRTRHRKSTAGQIASVLQISFIAYVTGGLFLNMAFFDLFYHLVAVTVCLEVIAGQVEEPIEPVVAGDEEAWWKRSPKSQEEVPQPPAAGQPVG